MPTPTVAILYNSGFFIGMISSRFLATIMLFFIALLIIKGASPKFKSCVKLVNSIGSYLFNPAQYFANKTRLQLLSICAQVNELSSKCSLILAMLAGTFSTNSKISLPANKARAATSPGGYKSATPFMFKASVIMMPSKPISLRNKSVIIGFDKEEGVLLVSSAGIFKCATITLITFSSISFLKG